MASTSKVVRFNADHPVYSVFDNFIPNPCPITLKEKEWPSSEHYFQAQKFAGTQYEEDVRTTLDPVKAKIKGRRYPLRADWEEVKQQVMYEAVYAKFSQHPTLAAVLLATGDADIVEHCGDTVWGDGLDGSGTNYLGIVLVKVREELKAQTKAEESA